MSTQVVQILFGIATKLWGYLNRDLNFSNAPNEASESNQRRQFAVFPLRSSLPTAKLGMRAAHRLTACCTNSTHVKPQELAINEVHQRPLTAGSCPVLLLLDLPCCQGCTELETRCSCKQVQASFW